MKSRDFLFYFFALKTEAKISITAMITTVTINIPAIPLPIIGSVFKNAL